MGAETHLRVRWGPNESDHVSRPFECVGLPLLTYKNLVHLLIIIRWGESAGSQSVAFQMLTNGGNTEGLFRAGWMESGSALPSGDFSKLQPTFDFIASEAGCASANDVLDCLRQAPADAITAAMNRTPTFLGFQVRGALSTKTCQGCLSKAVAGSKYAIHAPCRWGVSARQPAEARAGGQRRRRAVRDW